jgi:hypothetical protein
MTKYLVSKKAEKKKQYIAFDFASKSPEPCLVNSKAIHDKTTNRLLTENEKEINFLSTKIKYLNIHAWRLLSDLAWLYCNKKDFEKISRVNSNHSMFGKSWYIIRFVGSYGSRAQPIFLICEEDEDIMSPDNLASPLIIPGQRYVVPAIMNDTCPKCGSTNCRFKIKPTSKNTRCGACLSLSGIKKGL